MVTWPWTKNYQFQSEAASTGKWLSFVLKPADWVINKTIAYDSKMWANAQRDGRLPNIGGALCSTPHSLADAHY